MHINFLALTALINFFSALIFGLFVYFKNPKKKLNVLFGLMTLSIVIWSAGYFFWQTSTTKQAAFLWIGILNFGSAFVPLFYFHWVLSLLNFEQKYKKLLFFSYLATFIFSLFSFSSLYVKDVQNIFSFKYWPMAGPIYNFYLVFGFFGLVSYSLYLLYKSYIASIGHKREQIKYVLLGSIVGFGGAATNFPLWYGIYFSPIFNVLIALYPLTFAYAIIRYRLMDIGIIFRRSLLYTVLVAYVAGAFTFISLSFATFLHQISDLNQVLVTIVISFAIVLSLDPLKKYLSKLTDEIFFKAEIDYPEILKNISKIIAYELDLKTLLDKVIAAITKELKIKDAYILLSDKNKLFFKRENFLNGRKAIEFDDKNPLVSFFKRQKDAIVTEELDRIIANIEDDQPKIKKELEKVRAELQKLETAFCVPIFTDDNLTGILLLGNKLSGDMYVQDDIDLFGVLASQLAAALEKAKLYQEVHNFSQKLKSEVEKATEDLVAANEKLKKLDMIKTEFISIASHQLRTPLSGVKGYLSMLLEGDFGELDEKKREVVKDLFQNTERLVRLVNLFLNVSRIEMGKFTLEKSSVDMDALIEETIKEFAPEIEKKKLKVEFKKSGESKPIFADRDKIKDVVLNLLDNAIKYTDRGSITLETNFKLNRSGKKSICQFSIKDTGMGIKREDMDKLFGKFTRGTSLPDFTKTGSGLGLFIAKKNIEAHKGKIWVESAGEGKGSEFYFEVGEK